jgi:lysylphosphatidylglycerol synthetase-like protein (DUF2156 family)
VTVLATTTWAVQAWIAAPKAWQPAGLAATAILAPIFALLMVVGLPAILRLVAKPKRAIWDALVLVACLAIGLSIAAGRRDLPLTAGAALLLMLAGRPLWSELTDRRATRQGWGLLAAAGFVIFALFLVEWRSAVFFTAGAAILLASIAAACWGFLLLTKNAPLPLHSDRGPVRGAYATHAVAGVSPFALMRDKQYFWSRDGRAFLAYACRGDVALVLGPAIGPADAVLPLSRQFAQAAHRHGWRVAWYQVSASVADQLQPGPGRLLGSEALVDLATLALEGSSMAKLRHEVSRGRRNGVTVTVVPAHELTAGARQAMRTLAASWVSRHALGEMAYSVGRHEDRPDVPTVVGLAHDQNGRLAAYCTWLRLPAVPAVVLDELRRRPDAPAGTMDLLLFSSMDQLRSSATWASLGLAPLAGAKEADGLARLEGAILKHLGITSASASLFAFKGKYQPRWEPRYLVAERASDWPSVGVATFLVHYPAWLNKLTGRVPGRVRMAWPHLAAAVSFALVLVGLSGVAGAAAFSREGHPLYAVRSAILPDTGVLAASVSTSRHVHLRPVDSLKPVPHHRRVAVDPVAPHHVRHAPRATVALTEPRAHNLATRYHPKTIQLFVRRHLALKSTTGPGQQAQR